MPTIIFGTVGFVVLVIAYLVGAEVGGAFGSGFGVLAGLGIIAAALVAWKVSEKFKRH